MSVSLDKLAYNIETEFRVPQDLLDRDDIIITELYDWHGKHNPDYPLFKYRDDDGKLVYITYATANRAINRAARYVASSVGSGCTEAGQNLPVVAIFANTDSITFFCTALGTMRAGCTLFLVSTRNAPAALVDMFERTNTVHVLVSADDFMQDTADKALDSLRGTGRNVVKHAMPVFEDLFQDHLKPCSPFEAHVDLPRKFDMRANGIILHSSGSTGHPKPLAWTHERMFKWGQVPLSCDVDVRKSVMGCHGTPMFHGLGMFLYSSSPVLGFVIAVFKPASPPTVPTPDAVWKGLVATESEFSWSVPSFIEEWARDPEKVVQMRKMRGVIFGGAGLHEDVGDALANNGVSLHPVYGCTEVGVVNDFARADPGMDWAYWNVSKSIECYFQPIGDGTYEVVVLSAMNLPLPKANTKIGDRDAYATSDLVVPHPTKPGLWKIIGRADEQIVLVNGEKTNPLPLERMINEDPRVKCSVIFGSGRFQNGVLIEPTEEYAFEPNNVSRLEAFRNVIWSSIERVNQYAPQHSRIFKEMIIVTSPSKPFQFTVKGLPRRKIILDEYKQEIDALYEEVEQSSQSNFEHPDVWDTESTLSFVRLVVSTTLHRTIPDDADIFRHGGDSLQATWIRNTILRAVRDTNKDAAKRLPMNIVFSAPTISSLARVVSNAVTSAVQEDTYTPEDLWKYVDKYSVTFPARPENLVERPQGKDVVLITGTTGGFGCDTLEHLLRDEAVQTVFALNRKGTDAMERQRAQFRARDLDETLLDSRKFRMVEAVLHEPGFGLEPQVLQEMKGSVTHIVHNAWTVHFNLSISSFEVDLQGARNLVDFALSSPYINSPAMVFVSSVGVFDNYKLPPPALEQTLDDPTSPFSIGYSESKWITEHVLQNVNARTGMHTIVVRLGQVAGDRAGYWNEREWFPALVKSAVLQKCLPKLEGSVSWFPAYEAAKAFAEMRRSSEPILHLVHPQPTPWNTIMKPIADALDVPLVPYEQWLSSLENSAQSGTEAEVKAMKANPALRLLPFFKVSSRNLPEEREPMGLVYLSTEKARKVSPSLNALPVLDAERARVWVAAWKRAGFL